MIWGYPYFRKHPYAHDYICTALSKYPLATSYGTRPSLRSNTCVRDDPLAVEMLVFPSWTYHLPLWEGTSKRCSITHLVSKNTNLFPVSYMYIRIYINVYNYQLFCCKKLMWPYHRRHIGGQIVFLSLLRLRRFLREPRRKPLSRGIHAMEIHRCMVVIPRFFSKQVPLSLVINGVITPINGPKIDRWLG